MAPNNIDTAGILIPKQKHEEKTINQNSHLLNACKGHVKLKGALINLIY